LTEPPVIEMPLTESPLEKLPVTESPRKERDVMAVPKDTAPLPIADIEPEPMDHDGNHDKQRRESDSMKILKSYNINIFKVFRNL
jgi:hypothetical protein